MNEYIVTVFFKGADHESLSFMLPASEKTKKEISIEIGNEFEAHKIVVFQNVRIVGAYEVNVDNEYNIDPQASSGLIINSDSVLFVTVDTAD